MNRLIAFSLLAAAGLVFVSALSTHEASASPLALRSVEEKIEAQVDARLHTVLQGFIHADSPSLRE